MSINPSYFNGIINILLSNDNFFSICLGRIQMQEIICKYAVSFCYFVFLWISKDFKECSPVACFFLLFFVFSVCSQDAVIYLRVINVLCMLPSKHCNDSVLVFKSMTHSNISGGFILLFIYICLNFVLCMIWGEALTAHICLQSFSFPSIICWNDYFSRFNCLGTLFKNKLTICL